MEDIAAVASHIIMSKPHRAEEIDCNLERLTLDSSISNKTVDTLARARQAVMKCQLDTGADLSISVDGQVIG